MQFEITYLPRGCPESTNKIGNVGESSDYRVSIRQVPTGRKRRKKALHTREVNSNHSY